MRIYFPERILLSTGRRGIIEIFVDVEECQDAYPDENICSMEFPNDSFYSLN